MVIFAISGSLRETSSNTSILHTMKSVAPAGHEFIIYDQVGSLPHYNPDLDLEKVPAEVEELRGMISRAAVIIISTPEYAHGIPGSLKNALDWLVSTTLLENKPISIIIGSSSDGSYALTALIEILKTMNAQVIPQLTRQISGVQANAEDPQTWQGLRDLAENLILYSREKS